ncbi:MAG: radical SAM family heme chaperone HemW [Planctomycetota bacterium]
MPGLSPEITVNQAVTTPADPPRQGSVRGLYLHLPFCFHKCHYCDFFSVIENGTDRQPAFTDTLIRELEHYAEAGRLRPETVFVGGGTPTLLRSELWDRLLSAMDRLGVLEAVEEFTVEANPETVTRELMDRLAAGVVNRVSIGAQSFDTGLLRVLDRRHNPDSVGRAAEVCRASGITNISLDLIFAVPGQCPDRLQRDLDAALAIGPDHLSTYGLTYEPRTALTARLKAGQITPVAEDDERRLYAALIDRLQGEGFVQYEVSNWARPSGGSDALATCRHNLLYWTNADWIGLGPSAASHCSGHRWRNVPNLASYLQGAEPVADGWDGWSPPTEDHETLGEDDRIGEHLMLGLRLRRGVPRPWIDRHLEPGGRRDEEVRELIGIGMLEWSGPGDDEHLRLTDAGLFVADSVLARLL